MKSLRLLSFTVAVLLASAQALTCANAGEASAFFRTETDADGTDWLVSPGGGRVFSVGVCHVHPRGSHSHALGFSPYKRFVEENYPSLDAWADETAARLRSWGFTSLGAASDVTLLAGRGFPHVSHSALRMGQNFTSNEPEHSICPSKGAPCTALPNVFHPGFAAHCEKIAAERCAAAKDDPFLIGWYIDNELAWWGKNGQRATGVYDAIAALPPEHSAKKALDAFLAVWSSEADHSDGILPQGPRGLAGSPRGGAEGDAAVAFLRHFARTYFAITTAAIRKYDPNHLILGCRFAGLQGAHPVVWETCGEFCDVVSFNCYPWADLDCGVVLDEKCGVPMLDRFREYHGYAKKPMIVSEWSFPALDTGRPCFKGAGQRVPTQKERAEASSLFLRTMLAQPFVVGCEYFMWCDRPAQGGHKANAEDCNYGLVNEENRPYDELLSTLAPLLHEAAQLRGAATMPAARQQADGSKPCERDRYFAEARERVAAGASSSRVGLQQEPDGSWILSNAFVRVSGRKGSAFVADEIVICPVPEAVCPPLGRLGAMLQIVDDGTNTWIDTSRVTDVELSRDAATGIASVTLRAQSPAASPHPDANAPPFAVNAPCFAITTRLSLAPDSRELLAEILSVENLGDTPVAGWLPFLRPWSLAAEPEPVRMVMDRWAAPCEAEWKLADGGSWGIASFDSSAKRFRFFLDREGRQHPDARFSAVDPQGRAANSPIAPGETWRPASPLSARIYRKPAK